MRKRRSIGAQNELITVQAPAETPTTNVLGQKTAAAENWTDHLTAWAEVLVRGSEEFEKLGIVAGEVTHALRIHCSVAALQITNLMRVVRSDDSTLNIHAAYDPDNTRRSVLITCKSTNLS